MGQVTPPLPNTLSGTNWDVTLLQLADKFPEYATTVSLQIPSNQSINQSINYTPPILCSLYTGRVVK